MEISEILIPGAVKAVNKISSKKRLLQSLADLADSSYGINAQDAFEALQARENLGPTGVGQGVAIPHARLDGLSSVSGAFVRLDTPIDFDSVDRQPVDLVFALFAPVASGVEHLKALAQISRLMRDSAVRAKLRSNSNDSTLYTILAEKSSTKAA